LNHATYRLFEPLQGNLKAMLSQDAMPEIQLHHIHKLKQKPKYPISPMTIHSQSIPIDLYRSRTITINCENFNLHSLQFIKRTTPPPPQP
jgi:hypothetical protein